MKAFKAMFITEFKLSLRGMDMVIFALCMPVVVMVILGIIYGDKPAFEGASYTFLEQSFGAVAAIAIAAGGVMGLPLVIADYRQKKILKRFKVTPTRPSLILAVQLLNYALYALGSLILIYGVAFFFFAYQMAGSLIQFLGAYLLVMFSLFSIGLLVGGVAKNMKSASVLASLLYFPMLIFSGATLPYEVMPVALQKVADLMPLTHGIKLLKETALGQPMESVGTSILILLVLGSVCSFVAVRWFKWE